jgi:hypothetical protein
MYSLNYREYGSSIHKCKSGNYFVAVNYNRDSVTAYFLKGLANNDFFENLFITDE